MFELFANPWAMAAGTMLISSPIIIHLINRMRYRRIRWAAMEFLLKSQKKNRRRVIIEQIILLLLRILLVLLAGFLLARFIGAVAGSQQSTLHVVVLDDTASMADFHREEGKQTDAFSQAKSVIVDKIGQFASQANTPQGLVLIRLSDPDNPRVVERLNASTVEELRAYLADVEVTPFHVDMVKGIRAAETIFNQSQDDRKLLHIVSDFRTTDWTGGPADALRQALEQLKAMKIDVHAIDAAYPRRADNQKTALYHDNMAIVDFQPETRVAARFNQVEFTVSVANFSTAEHKNVRVNMHVGGTERREASVNLPSCPPGTVTTGTCTIAFDELGQNPVSANLENEEAGLAIDNVRHCVVEVREKVPLLIIEGDLKTKGTPESDGYFLQQLFSESQRGFDVLMKTPVDLEKLNLEQFPSIFVCNAGRLTDKAVQALEKYVRGGGGLVFFLGNEVKPDFYNKLYADGKGLFPAPLADKPSDPPASMEIKLQRLFNLSPKVYPRNEGHRIFAPIYRDEKTRNQSRENNKHLYFAAIDRYWPVPRNRWATKPGETEELMTLPNIKQITDYDQETNSVLKDMAVKADANPKFKTRLLEHERIIKDVVLRGGDLYKLVAPLDALLNDTGDPANPKDRPNLQEFWQAGDQAELRDRIARLLETVRYGDPFLVAKTVGKGRVVAYLTSANNEWNDMPSGPSRIYWVMLMVEMQKYLASNTADAIRLLGNPLEVEVEASRYDANVQRYFPPKVDWSKSGPINYQRVDAGKQTGEVNGNKLLLRFNEARVPGVYEFWLARKDAEGEKPMGPAAPPPAGGVKPPEKAGVDRLAFAFNVDAQAESNLQRVSQDEFMAVSGNVALHSPDDPAFESLLKNKKSDFSEAPWLYLIILIVLIAEQAMAVRLSFHTRSQEMAATFAATASTAAPAVAAPEPQELQPA